MPVAVGERLSELSDELDRPIRILSASRPAEYLWTSSQHDSRWTTEEANERGITVAPYGAVGVPPGPMEYSPSGTDLPNGGLLYDVLNVVAHPTTSPIYWGDVIVGDVGPRVVYSYLGLHRAYFTNSSNRTDINWEAILYEPICRSCSPTLLTNAEAAIQEREERLLREFAETIHSTAIASRRQQIAGWESNITRANASLREAYIKIREEQKMLDALLHLAQGNPSADLVREWNALKDHPRCASIRFRNQAITVITTDDLRLHHPDTGESRWLGQFTITMEPLTGKTTIINNSTHRNGRDHPHINNGAPCFGGNETAFAELLAAGEFYTYFDLMIQFLETVNLRDEWGRYSAYWLDMPDERPIEEVVAA
jgi:hypothetical protein